MIPFTIAALIGLLVSLALNGFLIRDLVLQDRKIEKFKRDNDVMNKRIGVLLERVWDLRSRVPASAGEESKDG